MQHELGCEKSWHGCVVGSFPQTMWLPRKYRPSELSTQEQPRQMGKEGYTIHTSRGGCWPRSGLGDLSGHPSPWCITEVCQPDQASGLRTRSQSSSSQRWRYGATARSRRTMASIIWDWAADQDSRFNSRRLGQAIVQAMAWYGQGCSELCASGNSHSPRQPLRFAIQ